MIRNIKDFNSYIAIHGFKDVKMDDVTDFLNRVRRDLRTVSIQLFNAKLVASHQHLYFAVLNALNAMEKKMNISANLSVETLLYASAQRQIKKAVEMLGVKPFSTEIAVLVIGKTESLVETAIKKITHLLSGEPDDAVLELTDEKFRRIKDLFGISDLELEAQLIRNGDKKEALISLIIEHVALLAIQR